MAPALPETYWITPRLLAGKYPASVDPAESQTKIDGLLAARNHDMSQSSHDLAIAVGYPLGAVLYRFTTEFGMRAGGSDMPWVQSVLSTK